MKAVYGIGVGVTFTMLSAGAWVGCSSSSSPSDAGTGSDSAASSSSSSGGSSSSSSSSGGSSSSSSSSSSSGGTGADGGDAGDAAGDADAAVVDAAPLTYSQVYADMIDAGHCTACHTPSKGLTDAGLDAGPGGGYSVGHLDLTSLDASYAALIGVPPQGTGSPGAPDAAFCNTLSPEAGSDSGVFRVVSGNAAKSLLCNKIHGFDLIDGGGAPFCGGPMPLSGEIPNGGQEALFNEVKTWINAGANP